MDTGYDSGTATNVATALQAIPALTPFYFECSTIP